MKSRDIAEIYSNYEMPQGIYNEINQVDDLNKIRKKWPIFSLINKKTNILDTNSSLNGRFTNEKNCAA